MHETLLKSMEINNENLNACQEKDIIDDPLEGDQKSPMNNQMHFSSTNLFAFGTSNTADFFSSLQASSGDTSEGQKEKAAEDCISLNQDCELNYNSSNSQFSKEPISSPEILDRISPDMDRAHSDIPELKQYDTKPFKVQSAISSRRKNSIEMFLSQSPSQALGGEFMKINFINQSDLTIQNKNGLSVGTSNQENDDQKYSSNTNAAANQGEFATNKEYFTNRRPANVDTSLSIQDDRRMSYTSNEMHASPSGYYYRSPESKQSSNYYASPANFNNAFQGTREEGSAAHAERYGITRTSSPISARSSGSARANNNGSWGYNGAQTGLNETSNQRMRLSKSMNNISAPSTSPSNSYNQQLQHSSSFLSNSLGGENVLYERERRPKVCKFFSQGHCRVGSKCKFAHTSQTEPIAQHSVGSSLTSLASLHEDGNYAGNQAAVTSDVRGSQSTGVSNVSSERLLEQLMNDDGSFSAELTVEELQGRVFAMSKDQNGCRLLQEHLCFETKSIKTLIYQESLVHLPEMMVDPFGNYLFQKLLEQSTETQKTEIVQSVSKNLVAAALNLHGTRSVQKVVEMCSNGEQLHIIVKALKDDTVRLCIDSNGNHVIQRALQHMAPNDNQFVFDAIARECTTVGTHRHGCCVLQRCLDAANRVQKVEVIRQVENHAMKLMQDPYGNYVVQYVLDSCSPQESAGVIQKPLGHIFELSIQKFSSNVIEKCLEKASTKVKESYLTEIINCPKLYRMLQDQFANYVVQRALSVCSDKHGLMLVSAIRPHLCHMKNTSGGRRITARILKRYPTMNLDTLELESPVASHHGHLSGSFYYPVDDHVSSSYQGRTAREGFSVQPEYLHRQPLSDPGKNPRVSQGTPLRGMNAQGLSTAASSTNYVSS